MASYEPIIAPEQTVLVWHCLTMPLSFTSAEIAEARKLYSKLDKLPRVRMKTVVGRIVLNGLLRFFQLYQGMPKFEGNFQKRTISSLGRKVDLRLFRPSGKCRGVMIEIHGGGWTIGNARMSDRRNADFSTAHGFAVVSVDYRLAVSHSIAQVVSDCEAAAVWTIQNCEREFDTTSIILQGDSAGAHLAALTLLKLRDEHCLADSIGSVVLFFGLYDFSGTPSVRRAGNEIVLLHAQTIRKTLQKLTPKMNDVQRRDASLSPLFANLHGLPSALFVVGEKDVLFEDSQLMEQRWFSANGNSEFLAAPESPHGFTRFKTKIAQKVVNYAGKWAMAHPRHRQKTVSARVS